MVLIDYGAFLVWVAVMDASRLRRKMFGFQDGQVLHACS
jgi:hypothetical protein